MTNRSLHEIWDNLIGNEPLSTPVWWSDLSPVDTPLFGLTALALLGHFYRIKMQWPASVWFVVI